MSDEATVEEPISFDATIVQGASSPAAATSPPELAGLDARYQIFGELGRGGAGVVYRGHHRGLDIPVAIKVLHPGQASARFLHEARLLARIQSPHVVRVHDFEVLASGQPMLVMEEIDGHDLGDAIAAAGGVIDEATGRAWMEQVARGMAAIEAIGVVHRDLKPQNLLIDAHGVIRVADLGLARGPVDVDAGIAAGDLMGTPLYMAPEQAIDPRLVDARADIYSFGATFYHALTGQPPFVSDTLPGLIFAHQSAPLTSPRSLRPALSAWTSEVLERCLAKSPSGRFQSFADLLAVLVRGDDGDAPWDAGDDDDDDADALARYRGRRSTYLAGAMAADEVDVYALPGGRSLRIRVGDLAAEAADALVSSDDEHLRMRAGVSAALARAGGRALVDAARGLVPVRPGRAVVTPAGDLPARFVFHGITLGVTPERPVTPSRDLIAEIVADCLHHADTFGLRSIAFPLLGTGTGGFSREVCLDTMVRALLRALRRGTTSVATVTIVLWAPARAAA